MVDEERDRWFERLHIQLGELRARLERKGLERRRARWIADDGSGSITQGQPFHEVADNDIDDALRW